jgi:hypothetical protein
VNHVHKDDPLETAGQRVERHIVQHTAAKDEGSTMNQAAQDSSLDCALSLYQVQFPSAPTSEVSRSHLLA